MTIEPMDGERAGSNLPCRVLVVESPSRDQLGLAGRLRPEAGLTVWRTAAGIEEAIAALRQDRPDVLLLDLAQPHPGGLAAIRVLVAEASLPVVVVADFRETGGVDTAMRAFRSGASEVLPRPDGTSRKALAPLVEALMAVARRQPNRQAEARPATAALPRFVQGVRVIVVGASTGGPQALREMLTPLPADFPVPIVVAQHIAAGFTPTLAGWLRGEVSLPVHVASHRMQLCAPGIYLCPDDHHAELGADGRLFLDADARGLGHRPAVDVLFWSAAAAFGSQAVGILLTGMGDDGARGLWRLREAAATTIVQDPASCVVAGMPAAALDREAAGHSLTPAAIAASLLSWAANRTV